MLNYKDKTREELINELQKLQQENDSLKALHVKDLTEYRQAEEEISLSETQLKRAELVSKSGNWELHIDAGIMTVSEGAAQIYGIEMAQFNYDVIKKIPLPEYRPLLDNALKLLIEEGNPYNVEFKIKTIDTGTIRDIHSQAFYNKEKGILFGVIQDITERKQVEETLLYSKKQYDKLAANIPAGVYVLHSKTDGSFKLDYASPRMAEMLGLSVEGLLNNARLVYETIYPDDRIGFAELSEHGIRIKQAFDWTGRVFVEGKIKWMHFISTPELLENGEILWHGLFVDITDSIQMEKNLRLTADQLNEAQEIGNMGSFSYNLSTKVLTSTPMLDKIFGLGVEKEKNPTTWNDLLHPEDRDEMLSAVENCIENGVPFDRDYRIIRDDQIIWLRGISRAELDSTGKVSRFSGVNMDITERRKAEDKLRESEHRYRQLVETANEAILVAQGDKFKFVNSMVSELTGYTEEELLSTPFIEFIYPDDRALVADNYMKRMKGEIFDENYNFRFIGKGNNIRWVEMTGVKIDWDGQPATLNFASDITSRKQAEEALIESERHATALIGAIPDLLFIMNKQGIFIDYKADIKDLSYQSATIIGKSIHDIMPPAFAGLIDEKILLTLQGKDIQKFEYQLEMPSMGMVDYEARMVPYGIDQVIAIVRDVTERKNAEAEIKQKHEDLVKANAEKDKFFSIIAHDLRGPIGGFMGLTGRMAEGMKGMTLDELQTMALIMNRASSNLYNLLGNLLDWSRMQRGLTTFEPVTFQLLPKIYENIVMVLDAADKKEITINNTIPENLEVFADENMLACIIRNLVANAVKFTPKGGNISISACSTTGNNIEISFTDSGIGMNKQMVENLFNFDVNTSRKGTDGELSTGLGLIICKDFIEKHGGELQVESDPDGNSGKKGSTFRVIIPGSPKREGKIVSADVQTDNPAKHLKRLKILIAEDDETSGMLISLALKSLCREILEVSTGFDAVKVCKSNPDIDLILMDIKMPGLSGYEATAQIRQFNKEVIIIAQTAFGLAGEREKAIKAGCNEYISKPLSVSFLKELIQKHFEDQELV